ncbi:MAG: hypothetical protein V4614_00040 [Pseudomonadota bacterium]
MTTQQNLKSTNGADTGATRFRWAAAAGLALLAVLPMSNASAQGALTPGVYGRIEFGTAPPPAVIYPQPVIIQRPAVLVQQPPLYLHVPPGHAKKWSKHCAKYNACGQPVYFVKVNGDAQYERDRRHGKHKGKHKDKGHDH